MTFKSQLIVFTAIILSLSLVSAQTLIAGKVYDSSNLETANVVSGANVSVTCNGNTLITTSLSDGTYMVKFDVSECTPNDSVSVSSNEGKATVVNITLEGDNTVPSNKVEIGGSSGGGSGRARVYICGNGVCDSGETQETCASDCVQSEETENLTEETETIELTPEDTSEDGFSITGAFIAIGNSMSLPILSGILGFLVVLLIGQKIIQRKNR